MTYGHAASLHNLCPCGQGHISTVIDGVQLCAKCALKEMQKMSNEVKYPNIHVQLSGTDGNAFAIIGTVQREIKRQGVSSGHFETQREANDAGNTYAEQAMNSESYDAMLQHAMRWVDVS